MMQLVTGMHGRSKVDARAQHTPLLLLLLTSRLGLSGPLFLRRFLDFDAFPKAVKPLSGSLRLLPRWLEVHHWLTAVLWQLLPLLLWLPRLQLRTLQLLLLLLLWQRWWRQGQLILLLLLLLLLVFLNKFPVFCKVVVTSWLACCPCDQWLLLRWRRQRQLQRQGPLPKGAIRG